MDTSTTTAITLREPRDLIAWVPYHLGFRPRDSLVLAAVRRTGREFRIGLTARLDYPPDTATGLSQAAANAYAHALDPDRQANAVIAIIYSDLNLEEQGDQAKASARLLEEALETAGREAFDVFWVGEHGWGSLLCDDAACCPARGRPLEQLTDSSVSAQMIFAGQVAAASVAEMLELPAVSEARRESVAKAALLAADWRRSEIVQGRHEMWAARSIDRWRDAMQRFQNGTEPAASLLGRLAVALCDSWIRDAVLVDIAGWGGRSGDDEAEPDLVKAVATRGGGPEVTRIAAGIAGALDEPPAESRLRLAERLLRHCAACFDDEHRPPCLTVLAWIEWARGHGSAAGHLLDQALQIDPEYRLAVLMETAVSNALMPAWVMQPR
ncbi:DUF4192 domain-containing protein [Saxibacter everestensis]|uniref:DUF4192 domain-containing protein n=1 Tax=Saxibacter everestensis TaxID=2909229 RepID=A0ABY8QWG9_9MICO|nr:DUF4192 domain-containing protein [Brevibacteriaceae bacterium ZFBP1038]